MQKWVFTSNINIVFHQLSITSIYLMEKTKHFFEYEINKKKMLFCKGVCLNEPQLFHLKII